ncbi:MAG: DNA methyltransferase, partial [Nitrospinales bacterium]
IKEFGFRQPIVVDGEMVIVVGHTRYKAARKLELEHVPVHVAENLTPEQAKAYRIMDNRSHEDSVWDEELLKLELQSLDDADFDLDLTGFDEDYLAALREDKDDHEDYGEPGSLSKKFLVPPFSVLDTRLGYWQERKRYWLNLGIESEIGRDENLLKGDIFNGDWQRKVYGEDTTKFASQALKGSSVFDPVLCELVYLWFSSYDGVVLDPFSGGSVRGIVASKLGRNYVGMDLRPEQVEANNQQAERICQNNLPVWETGDSREIDQLDVQADLVFSCPPYHDLEVYSDDPKDVSNMPWPEFVSSYREIVSKAVGKLKDNRFACFVVTEIRDKKTGLCKNLVRETVLAFQDAGAVLYNDAILINVAGSLPLRTKTAFEKSRKLGRMHQNVLIFVKGDPVKAAEAAGYVEVADPENLFGEIYESAEA